MVISPTNLLGSIPPKISSPLVSDSDVVGSKEIPTSFVASKPSENALSVTVGTVPPPVVVSALDQLWSQLRIKGEDMPSVRSVGPMLEKTENQHPNAHQSRKSLIP